MYYSYIYSGFVLENFKLHYNTQNMYGHAMLHD